MAKPSLAGKPLVDAAYRLLMKDKSMVGLLFVGGLCSALAVGLIVVPASIVHGSLLTERDGVAGLGTYALALLLSTFVSTLFMGAVVAAAMIRAVGGHGGGLVPTRATDGMGGHVDAGRDPDARTREVRRGCCGRSVPGRGRVGSCDDVRDTGDHCRGNHAGRHRTAI